MRIPKLAKVHRQQLRLWQLRTYIRYFVCSQDESPSRPAGICVCKMDQIPIVDISGSRADLDLARELVDAAATCGFVFVKNEGKYIPVKNIDDAFALVSLWLYLSAPMLITL